MQLERHDAVVVGSGQGGMPMANFLAKEGKKVALIEARHVGGSCINHGCTPTKTMIASARAAYLAGRAGEFGLRDGNIETQMAEIVARKQRVVSMFRDGSTQGLVSSGVELIRGHARFSGPRRLAIELAGGGSRSLEAQTIILNTGARPQVPPIDGLGEVPWLDSTSIMELHELPDHLIVIGGGYIGLEFAQMFRRFGSRVTVVQRGPQLLASEDEDIARAVEDVLNEDGIDVRLGADVTRAARGDGDAIEIEVKGRADASGTGERLRGSHLLIATGRRPNTDDLDLARAGVQTDDRGYVSVTDRLETTAPGVFALGDIKPGPAFTHISFDDSRVLRKNLIEGGDASIRGRLVPYAIFTDPQLGRVGLSEAEAKRRGIPHQIARMPAGSAARAIELGETRGLWKVLVNPDSGAILGAAILGVEGGEVMAMLQIAMMGELPYPALRDTAFAHPTLAESLNNLFSSLEEAGGSPPTFPSASR